MIEKKQQEVREHQTQTHRARIVLERNLDPWVAHRRPGSITGEFAWRVFSFSPLAIMK